MALRTLGFAHEQQVRLKIIGLDPLVIPGKIYRSLVFSILLNLIIGLNQCCRGAGIGTPEAIRLVWSCHREIIYDQGPVPANWTTPNAS